MTFNVGDKVQVRDKRDGQLALEEATVLLKERDGIIAVETLLDGKRTTIGVPASCVEPYAGNIEPEWRVGRFTEVGVKGIIYHVCAGDESIIASHIDTPEHANLIAAAPELRDALADLLKIRSGRTVKAARAALAKAGARL